MVWNKVLYHNWISTLLQNVPWGRSKKNTEALELRGHTTFWCMIDVNSLSENKNTTKENKEAVLDVSRKICLKVKAEKN
jgi:hypothetical protein